MIAGLRSRAATVFAGFCLGNSIIIGNLLLLQIKNAHFFSQLGSQQYREIVIQPPPRATILDRSGSHYFAMNKDCVSAFITPHKLAAPNTLYPFLKEQFPDAYARLMRQPHKKFLYVARRLQPDELARIEKEGITDIRLITESSRFYPVASAAPIIGLTDIDNSGAMGIEQVFNTQLAGTPTTYILEKDARSGRFYFTRETTVSGESGDPLHLSIDADLQFLVAGELQVTMDKFKAKGGSAILMDPETGEILSMVSLPTFDPNNPRQLRMDDTANAPLTEAHELGSVMKIFSALAALEEGAVEKDELIDCKDAKTATVAGRTVNTWRANGTIPFIDVIAQSNNIGTASVANRIGEALYTHYTRLGFGRKTGIELPGEQAGHVNPPHHWSAHSIISLSYGYELSATLLQMASAFSMIANGGFRITPTILRQTASRKETEPLYSPQNIAAIQEILEKTGSVGTARAARVEGYRVMCKTGTANMLDKGIYNHEKNIYTCAGIVEKTGYKRVIAVSVREGTGKSMYAATVAAPLFGRIARKMLIHDRVV